MTKIITVSIPVYLLQDLDIIVKKQVKTRSLLIREAIENYLKGVKNEQVYNNQQ